MLGALSLKWKWKERREAESKPVDKPNLVFGGDVHVVWEKFCRYFDVEPRIVPPAGGQVRDRARGRRAPRRREHDRRRRRARHHLHRPRRRHRRHQRAPGRPQGREGASTCRSTSTRASGGFVWPFLYPRLRVGLPARAGALDQRLRPQVRARLPGHRLARLPREEPTSPRTSSSTRTTWAKPTRPSPSTSPPAPRWCSPSTTTSSASGARATRYVMKAMEQNAKALAEKLEDERQLRADRRRTRSSCRWSPSSSPARRTTTSSTSPGSSRPSAAGCSPPTRCRPTPKR